jgi:NADH-quinone oxidoreductase subunit B
MEGGQLNPTDQAMMKADSHFGQDRLLADSVVLTRLDKALGWARKYSLFPYPFATACCAMEYMSLSMSPYDIDRFGALLPRFSPRQADLLMVKCDR